MAQGYWPTHYWPTTDPYWPVDFWPDPAGAALYVDLVGYVYITGTTSVTALAEMVLARRALQAARVGELAQVAAPLQGARTQAQAVRLAAGVRSAQDRTNLAPLASGHGGTDQTRSARLAGALGGQSAERRVTGSAAGGVRGPAAARPAQTGIGGP